MSSSYGFMFVVGICIAFLLPRHADSFPQGVISNFGIGFLSGISAVAIIYFVYRYWGKIEIAAFHFAMLLGMLIGVAFADLYRGYSYVYVISMYVCAIAAASAGFHYIYKLDKKKQ